MPEIRVRDITMYYEERGRGRPLLLLHGLGSSVRDWELQMPVFSRQYRVIAVDMRGHGRSAKPKGPYSLPMFAADTAEFIRRLALAPVHVVGISMGGMIALQLAVDAPELLKSMALVNCGPELVPRTFKEKLQVQQRMLITRIMGMRRMGEFLAPRLFPKPDQATLRQLIAERWAKNDRRAYLASLRALVGWSVAAQLSQIACPTLVVAAEEDYTPITVKEAYAAEMPNARLHVIEDSRHATPIDQPEQFNQVVLAFLAQVDGSPQPERLPSAAKAGILSRDSGSVM
ncbi:MAG: alpha/beta fold hydrolase [Anaerolineae bacterium]